MPSSTSSPGGAHCLRTAADLGRSPVQQGKCFLVHRVLPLRILSTVDLAMPQLSATSALLSPCAYRSTTSFLSAGRHGEVGGDGRCGRLHSRSRLALPRGRWSHRTVSEPDALAPTQRFAGRLGGLACRYFARLLPTLGSLLLSQGI